MQLLIIKELRDTDWRWRWSSERPLCAILFASAHPRSLLRCLWR